MVIEPKLYLGSYRYFPLKWFFDLMPKVLFFTLVCTLFHALFAWVSGEVIYSAPNLWLQHSRVTMHLCSTALLYDSKTKIHQAHPT